jgi:hypothetical protein
MSEKWETVGKSPSAQKKGKKPAKPMPTLEDILPKGSLMSVTNYHEVDLRPAKTAEPVKAPEKGKPDAKKKKESAPAPVKPKVPKDIHEAVKMNLRVDDVRQLIDVCQTKFPDSPILWLRDLASYLNIKLVNQGPSEFQLFDGLPLSTLSTKPNMKKAIFGMVQSLDVSVVEIYAEICVSNIAHEMAKDLSVLGWVLMAQVIAETHPQVMVANVSRVVELRNSYQNRPSTCIAIMKALGEAGGHDLNVGIKVWMEVMLPLLNMRSYTKFVVDYITKLLDHHKITETSKVCKPVMDISNFFTMQDTVFVVASQLNKEFSRQLTEQYPRLKHLALAGYANHELFPEMMNKLKSQNMPNQVVDSLDVLSHCLIATPAAMVHWQQLYISQLAQSGYLLQYINSKWDNLKRINTPLFRDTIQAFQDYNITVSHKQDAVLCQEGCASVLYRISRETGSRFPWKFLSLLFLVGIAAIVNQDIQANTTFEKSHVAAFLKDAGQYERVCAIRDESLTRSEELSAWGRKNLPEYYATAEHYATEYYAAASKHAGPALEQAGQAIKISADFVQEQLKIVFQMMMVYGEKARVYIETQAPGVQLAGEQALQQAKTHSLAAYETVKAKTMELIGDVDWVQVKDKALVNLEQARVICLQYVDKLVQQINELVK